MVLHHLGLMNNYKLRSRRCHLCHYSHMNRVWILFVNAIPSGILCSFILFVIYIFNVYMYILMSTHELALQNVVQGPRGKQPLAKGDTLLT